MCYVYLILGLLIGGAYFHYKLPHIPNKKFSDIFLPRYHLLFTSLVISITWPIYVLMTLGGILLFKYLTLTEPAPHNDQPVRKDKS